MIAASRQVVCVVGHMETKHGFKEVQVGRDKVKVCKIYAALSCDDHVNVAKKNYGTFFNGTFGMPAHVWLDPTGKELFRKNGGVGPADFLKDLEKAMGMVPGPKVAKTDYDSAIKIVNEGDTALGRAEFRKSIEAFTKVSKLKVDRLKALGDERLKTVEAKGDALIGEANEKIAAAPDEAKAILKRVADEFKPLNCSKMAADLLKGLSK